MAIKPSEARLWRLGWKIHAEAMAEDLAAFTSTVALET
jgi:hypothetical protein